MKIYLKKKKRKILVRLHRQLGNASADRLVSLLTSAGVNRKEVFPLLEELVDNCEICIKYKKLLQSLLLVFLWLHRLMRQ